VAVLAADALGPAAVHALYMPSRYSSDRSRDDASALAARLGIDLQTVSIERPFTALLEDLKPLFRDRAPDETEENLQARVRGMLVMAQSNKFGYLVLTTGNKSEFSVGYCTLYGDTAGGFAVLKDVPKTLVFRLCRWRNTQAGTDLIPESILTRPPTAELRPNQTDQDSLPPYDILDEIIRLYVEEDRPVQEILDRGIDPAVVRKVVRLIDRTEYKRRQTPPGIKITHKAFGRDRRMPITNRYHSE
jgi:NAD+ synthase (glutamine-hydrolysing)